MKKTIYGIAPLLIALGFSAAVGIFFGFWPARKTAASTRSRRCATSSRCPGADPAPATPGSAPTLLPRFRKCGIIIRP